ncbi:MAG: NAD(P)-dependent oxidoreductase [Nitriliruptoraceae bacterium]
MQVAYLGLGAMGRPMAANLAARWPTAVWNRTSSVAHDHHAAHGTTVVEDLRELPPVDVVCSCLPTDVEVAAVAEVVAPTLSPGTVWIDHTSGDPAGSRDIAAVLAAHDVGYLDAPVSGGTSGAAAGTLSTMVGGDAGDLEAVRPVLETVASRIVHVGPVGAGMAVKAVNNALLATSLWAAAEGMTALTAAGVDPAAALSVIGSSTGRSFATEELLPERVLTRAFPHTFALALLAKDVRLARGVLEDSGVEPRVLGLVEDLTTAAAAELDGADHVELVRLVERAVGVEIASLE